MAKKVRIVDSKTQQIVSVIEISAGEIVGAAQDAGDFIMKINKRAQDLNADLQQEKITQEEASALYQAEIIPLHARLENRFLRMLKNTKALGGLLGAAKSLTAGEEDKDKAQQQ